MNSPVVEKTGGVAYEVILKQANKENTPVKCCTPSRSVSSASIEKKLSDAKERRILLEKSKQENWLKEKLKFEEVSQRAQQSKDDFVKETEKKLLVKMETQQENREAQTKALLSRLQAHSKRVDEVRKLSEVYTAELKARVEKDIEEHGGKRESQLAAIQDRLKEHGTKKVVEDKLILKLNKEAHEINKEKKHVDEVLQNNKDQSRQMREKIVAKMERTLKNKEVQLEKLMQRIREHNTKAGQKGKTNLDDSISPANMSTLNIN